MTLFALTKTQEAGGQIALAALLGIVGFFLLLPRPRGRFVPGGIAALIGSAAVFGVWVYSTFGNPVSDVVGTVLFWLFSAGALIFGIVLVVQKNPARGAIAFAFVILSTCGLFLLLAAPFLMAATIIIYAGAIIVTFLFVLMLSHAEGPSDENNRSREPLSGGLAGFAFVGLVLFALYQTSLASSPEEVAKAREQNKSVPHLPMAVLTPEERQTLAAAITKLDEAEKALDGDIGSHTARDKRIEAFDKAFTLAKNDLALVIGGPYALGPNPQSGAYPDQTQRLLDGSLRERLVVKKPDASSLVKKLDASSTATTAPPDQFYREDQQALEAIERAARIRSLSNGTFKKVEDNLSGNTPDVSAAKAEVRKLRDEVVILHGMGQLPARNVANIGFVLYAGHLLAVELAGTLLLVATIGAVAVAHRKGVAQ